jgi:hypothetical protein
MIGSANNGLSLPNRKRRESPDPPSENEEYKPPKAKQRITEEKMAAELRNFHISRDNASRDNPEWFFMKRPPETFQEIESRMSDDEEIEDNNGETGRGPKLELNKHLKEYLEAKANSFTPWIRTPSNSMAVVLWKPSENFVDGIIEEHNNSRIQEISPELHKPQNAPNGCWEVKPEITYPPSDDENNSVGPTTNGHAHPHIQEIMDSDGIMECDDNMEL